MSVLICSPFVLFCSSLLVRSPCQLLAFDMVMIALLFIMQ